MNPVKHQESRNSGDRYIGCLIDEKTVKYLFSMLSTDDVIGLSVICMLYTYPTAMLQFVDFQV